MWHRLRDPCDVQAQIVTATVLLIWEAICTTAIIAKVSYTEIDWLAYMQEVGGFMDGERDYAQLRGDTGPLVYPAGFVYLFSALRIMTQQQVFKAQCIFAIVYLLTQAIVMSLYIQARSTPPYALALLTLSKRMHSLYVLRLFNDCWAMLVAYIALALLTMKRWTASIVAFSAAVSIKMNVLLMAPPVLAVCLTAAPRQAVLFGVVLAVALQIGLSAPFLAEYPSSYLSAAFEFSRTFMYKWTVNWKMLPEKVFLSSAFAKALLILHLGLLVTFAHFRWLKVQGGILHTFASFFSEGTRQALRATDILRVVFIGNFIGVLCARSLHYQFYSWYFHSLPMLLWSTYLPVWVKVVMFFAIEYCWNVFPASATSSSILLLGHVVLLVALWCTLMQTKVTKRD